MEAAVAAFLNPPLCANTAQVIQDEISSCKKTANQACAGCMLVQYCSKQCQTAHWSTHKNTCKSDLMSSKYVTAWWRENRRPSFVSSTPFSTFGKNEFLWGNMPALDVLKVKSNEGASAKDMDFDLLFAASGDLRNVIKTINNLPDGYKACCRVVVNDRSFAVVARNIIILLVALHLRPDIAVPIIIHLWYSAFLPRAMLTIVQSEILPHVEAVCSKIQDKPAFSMQAKKFKVNDSSVRVVLRKEDWARLAKYMEIPDGLCQEGAQLIRHATVLAPERIDHLDRALYSFTPHVRAGTMKFKNDGVLLPFGCSIKEFDTPNPTFFQDPNVWPMKDSADPHDGWNRAEYASYALRASKDTYGSLFSFLRETSMKFCKRFQKIRISFELFHLDACELPEFLDSRGKRFDRIELANICDRGWIGPEACLMTYAPLLKAESENRKATLLMLFINACPEVEQSIGAIYDQSEKSKQMKRLTKLIGQDSNIMNAIARGDRSITYSPEFLRRSVCHGMFADFEKFFDIFLKNVRMDDIAKANGVKVKGKHSIIEPWPYRVTARTTKKDFELLASSSLSGYERYVEFEKAS